MKNVENGVFIYTMCLGRGQDANLTVFVNMGDYSGDERRCPLDFLCTVVPLIVGVFVLVKILKIVVNLYLCDELVHIHTPNHFFILLLCFPDLARSATKSCNRIIAAVGGGYGDWSCLINCSGVTVDPLARDSFRLPLPHMFVYNNAKINHQTSTT